MASYQYTDSPRRFGLIILGNSGVGKSFIGNLFLGHEAFEHKSKPRAVTTTTEFEETKVGDDTYAIFNIPGLIEAKQSQIDKNKEEIDKAFQECPTSVIIYVFGVNNGRIRSEDIIAFNALNDAYPFGEKSLVLVVNTIPSLKERDEHYEGETIVLLREELSMKKFEMVCFLDKIDPGNDLEKRQLRKKLLSVVISALPKEHIKQRDISLRADEIAGLITHMKDMMIQFAKERREWQGQIRTAQKQHEREMKEQQENFQQLKEKLRALETSKPTDDTSCVIL